MHLCLDIEKKKTKKNHVYLIATRNSEIGVTGRHQTADKFFSKQELKPLAQSRHSPFFVKYQEKRWPKCRLCATGLGE